MKRSISKLLLVIGALVSLALPALASADEPLSWTAAEVSNTDPFLSVSCPTSSLCVAGDESGNLAVSTNPLGGASAWTAVDIGDARILGISCPSVTLCVVGDSDGNIYTATNPTGGASAWTGVHVSDSITALSCPSTSLCVAGTYSEDILSSTNPTGGASTWKVGKADESHGIEAVSCPSVSLCIAVGHGQIFGGYIWSSTNPGSSSPTWTGVGSVTSGAYIFGLSCPSVSLCVANGGHESIWHSDKPTEKVKWTTVELDTFSFNGISCPTVSWCAASDTQGNVWTSANPTGQAVDWTKTSISSSFLHGISCPTVSLCVTTGYAMGTYGAVFVGAPGNVAPPPPKEETPPPGETPGGGNGGSGGGSTPPPLPIPIPKPVECTVPSLKGKSLAKAKKLLTQSHCALGKVKKTNKAKKVVKQSPKSGTLPSGSKVAITLG